MTEESKADSVQSLSALGDTELKLIIEQHAAGLSPIDTVDKIRTDEALRIDLAEYLMKKVVTDAEFMPDRVRQGGQKNGNHPGYPDTSSREYAVLLAISMLDGTFISKRSVSDPVEFISRGNETNINGGQHRLAAIRLLDLNPTVSPKHIEQVRHYS